MTSQDPERKPTRMLAVAVGRYKNLASVELPWAPVTALFGPNGAGKTNLLECLALMLGTDRTLNLVRRRAALPEPGQLRCVAEVSPRRLPSPPDIARELLRVPDLAEQAATDLAWWQALGADEGSTPATALRAATALPEPLRSLLLEHADTPSVAYALQAMPEHSAAARIFTCDWVIRLPSAEVLAVLGQLPPSFRPALPVTAGYSAVLALPTTGRPPARLEWLAGSRSSEQVTSDLDDAYGRASPSVASLADLAATVVTTAEDAEPDAAWWLQETAANRAREELTRTLPGFTIRSGGVTEPAWTVTSAERDIADTGEPHFLAPLSAAERRWVDEALATLARQLDDHGRRSEWQQFFWSTEVEASAPDEAVVEITGDLADAVARDGYVSAAVLERVAELFDTQLAAAARSWLAGDQPARSELTAALIPAVADLLEPPLTIRVFDEPEAHMHPAAQRLTRDAVASLARRGEDIVLSTHSPYFLSHRDWAYAKVADGSLAPLADADLATTADFAQQMGLTTGELLSAYYRQILLVEGKHDQALLDAFYRDDLRDAGIAVLPLHGTRNAMALVESEFWLRLAGIPFTVMFDNIRLATVQATTPHRYLTDEEGKLRELFNAAKDRGRSIRGVHLERPDITAYLAEDLFADRSRFPGWEAVVDAYRKSRNRGGFKGFVQDNYGIDLSTNSVHTYVARMIEHGLRPAAELERAMHGICARS